MSHEEIQALFALWALGKDAAREALYELAPDVTDEEFEDFWEYAQNGAVTIQ